MLRRFKNSRSKYHYSLVLLWSLAACIPGQEKSQVELQESEVFGVSPETVLVTWAESTTSDYYELVPQRSTQSEIATKANQSLISGLIQQSVPYVYSVFGVRGQGMRDSKPLAVVKFKPWPTFEKASFSYEQLGLTTLISWDYKPWHSGLAMSENAKLNTRIECAFSTKQNINNSFEDSDAIVNEAFMSDGNLVLTHDRLDPYSTYFMSCKAHFVDGVVSQSTNTLELPPLLTFAGDCPKEVIAEENSGVDYRCDLNLVDNSTTNIQERINRISEDRAFFSSLNLSLSQNGSLTSCQWIQQDGNSHSFINKISRPSPSKDLPFDALSTVCTLAVNVDGFQVYNWPTPYTSQIEVKQPDLYNLFPSFAVRALSGALAGCHLGYTCTPPKIEKSDVFSDFGNELSYFMGGSNPFSATSDTRLYGLAEGSNFNVVDPNQKIDGVLVIPKVEITNSNFLAQLGLGSEDTWTLSNMLTAQFLPQGETAYRSAAKDSFKNGVLEEESVEFIMPNASKLQSYTNGASFRTLGGEFGFRSTDASNQITQATVSPSGTGSVFSNLIEHQYEVTSQNNAFIVSLDDGTSRTITLAAGTYSGVEMFRLVELALNNSFGNQAFFKLSFEENTSIVKVTSSRSFKFSTPALLLGFNTATSISSFTQRASSESGAMKPKSSFPDFKPRTILCLGDVVLDETMILSGHSASSASHPDEVGAIYVETNLEEGCRIYSTQSIFIQGHLVPIRVRKDPSAPLVWNNIDPDFVDILPDAVIQLSSAKSVIFGFVDTVSANNEMSLSGWSAGRRGPSGPLGTLAERIMLTSKGPSLTTAGGFLQSIAEEGERAGSAIPDFFRFPNDYDSNSNLYPSSISGNSAFAAKNLVVHAPIFLWNYHGDITGSIIAEIALFPYSLNFSTEAFPTNTKILPLYGAEERPLQVKSSLK